ncbi:hypothetical protein GIB67_004705, partial [Kingdonia uniflora]
KLFTKDSLITNYNKNSLIWTGLKEAIATVKAHSTWITGFSIEIDFWRDYWGSDIALIDLLDIHPAIWKLCKAKLGQIISQHALSAPLEVLEFLGTHSIDLNNIILNVPDQDIRVWKYNPHSQFSVKSTFENISSHLSKVWWHSYITYKAI